MVFIFPSCEGNYPQVSCYDRGRVRGEGRPCLYYTGLNSWKHISKTPVVFKEDPQVFTGICNINYRSGKRKVFQILHRKFSHRCRVQYSKLCPVMGNRPPFSIMRLALENPLQRVMPKMAALPIFQNFNMNAYTEVHSLSEKFRGIHM